MTSCEKCNPGKGFCPVTFGLALGLTCALGVLVCAAWMKWFGMPAMMVEGQLLNVVNHTMAMQPITLASTVMMAVCALLKGFVAGFVFALIYDLIRCCKAKCCGQCSCCSTPRKK